MSCARPSPGAGQGITCAGSPSSALRNVTKSLPSGAGIGPLPAAGKRRGRCRRRRSHGGRKRCSKMRAVSKPAALMNRKRPQHCYQRNSSRERCGGGGGSVDANPGVPVTWRMPLASLQCGQ
ncbi:hypothetical protein TraAM80_09727 [Trypanosoma rangeli]|uniref:Uncharacterized protein n=1 Tax=Trypanosoma rangeli TaxID=5698 RepID=A0A3R7LZG3_TRYRA|nr:uncharacterized protein TraAM80_09727 [Trypanosoma rangeli]RNE96564.1 hypothetical protein TraAM80_09727 [Trypanosoma rangeli]|eukprot:RNE96564.1 hypothetical protein TraAM80_09727 [Trypanosoma rangeli]